MYQYDEFDQKFVEQRSREFRDQVRRRLSGELSEEEFKPLRLMNGVYLQLHAYMFRIAIPYGILSSDQLRMLAHLADKYDKGYGHFTTRQNIQFNWPKLVHIPDMLDDLASVQMHAIQTSGNCIRNVTSDAFAGVAGDEQIDPRPSAELLRQWSSLHPEFAYLPRKFKFAVIGAHQDRAAMKFHDIGLQVRGLQVRGLQVRAGEPSRPLYDIWVGGGQGRTPRVARLFKTGVSLQDLMPTLDSMLRVYNLLGRRDNKYKARIKVLIDEYGLEPYRRDVEADMKQSLSGFEAVEKIYDGLVNSFAEGFRKQKLKFGKRSEAGISRVEQARLDRKKTETPSFEVLYKKWQQKNLFPNRNEGFVIVTVSLKPRGGIPGDATSRQMRAIAELADRFSLGEVRVTHRQNLVLPHVRECDLPLLFVNLLDLGLAEDNVGHVSDIISCPGLDYCALATARSIPVAQILSDRLRLREGKEDLSDISLNISGCINACSHHHAANIGILGLNRKEQEYYQITLGGRSDEQAQVGEILGPGFSHEEVPDVIDRILDFYLANREVDEKFADAYQRLGKEAFREAVYVN